MSTLLVFTENYWPGVAGESYLVDLVNGTRGLFENVVLAYNPEALNDEDLRKLDHPFATEHVRVLTSTRLWALTHDRWPRLLSVLAVRAAQALDLVLFECNVHLGRRLIRRTQPSAVLSFNGGYPAARSVLAMAVAARREGLPSALVCVSMPVPRRKALRWYEAWLDRRISAATDLIIVNAPQIGNALSDMRGLPADKMRVVHNSLSDGTDRATQCVSGGIKIGCVARMDHLKGIPHLLDAFEAIAKRYPDAELVLVGAGPALPELQRSVLDRGLGDRITFTGYYSGEIASIVSTFQIYAYPSLWEGLPYAILEAMRAGCAIVATDVGGVAEAVIDGETGLLIRPGESAALADALDRLLADAELRARLAVAARHRFEMGFSLEAMHVQTAEVFAELAGVKQAAKV